MSEIIVDCYGAKAVSSNYSSETYNKLYPQVNENLVDIYLDLDFEDKDVLSVVSSSDQIYTSKLLGAKHVDGFDINKLTKYYYYMRRWAITYNNDIYPYGLIDGSLNYLEKILKRVKASSKDEVDALKFWRFVYYNNLNVDYLFFEDNVNDGKTLFDENVRYLKDVCLEDLNYSNIDFFEKIKSHKKYDFILMSNIIEYCYGNKEKLKTARDNLSRLLKKNGKVICSRLINKRLEIDSDERSMFEELFELADYGPNEGYVYIKK